MIQVTAVSLASFCHTVCPDSVLQERRALREQQEGSGVPSVRSRLLSGASQACGRVAPHTDAHAAVGHPCKAQAFSLAQIPSETPALFRSCMSACAAGVGVTLCTHSVPVSESCLSSADNHLTCQPYTVPNDGIPGCK